NISDLIQLALIRNIFSVSVHFIATAIFGCFLALSKFKSLKKKILYLIIGYLISVFIHSFWNFLVTYNWTFIYGLIFVLVALILIFGLIQISLAFEKNIIFYEMNDEILNGNLRREFASIISNYRLRKTKGWIRENLRKDYINLATTLAFRKNQLRNISSEKLKSSYESEIIKLREKLKQLELEAKGLLNLE
ncbi:MAG: PrsW family glutamic-type intramembrane protease, partial [Ignavibacteria bacterium]